MGSYPLPNAVKVMCDVCVEIDKRIDRLKSIARSVEDPQTVRIAYTLIAEMEARKSWLHPEHMK
jgi:pyruvate kinase